MRLRMGQRSPDIHIPLRLPSKLSNAAGFCSALPHLMLAHTTSPSPLPLGATRVGGRSSRNWPAAFCLPNPVLPTHATAMLCNLRTLSIATHGPLAFKEHKRRDAASTRASGAAVSRSSASGAQPGMVQAITMGSKVCPRRAELVEALGSPSGFHETPSGRRHGDLHRIWNHPG